MTNEYNESPEAIKTDIERTRQNMSQKIDQIQARLSPGSIKAQAQETVRDIVRDSTESLTGYLSENSKDLGVTLAHAIKSNPIPAALIGVGIGWLLVESYGGSRSSNQDDSRQRNAWQRDEWYGESRYAGAAPSSQYTNRETTPSFTGQYQGAGSPSQYAGSQYSGSQYQASGTQYSSDQGRTGGYASYTASDQPGWIQDKAANLKDQLGDKAEQLRDTVQQVGEQVSEKVGEWTDSMRSQSNAATDQAGYYANQARGQMANLGEQASYVGHEAQAYARQTGQQLQRSLEDNPLVFGGVALAIGALIGMALPATRRENEMLGPWRDEVMQSAQEVASDVVERAQHVVEEVRPQLEQTAQKVVSDLKQSGQSALEDVKQSGREAFQDVKQTGREALQEVKQTGRTALDETKREGKEAVDNAQQKVAQTADTIKREANKSS